MIKKPIFVANNYWVVLRISFTLHDDDWELRHEKTDIFKLLKTVPAASVQPSDM